MNIAKLVLVVSLFSTKNILVDSQAQISIIQKNFTVLKDCIRSWNNSSLDFEFTLKDNQTSIFSVRNDTKINGYIVMDQSTKDFRSFYEGKYFPSKEEFETMFLKKSYNNPENQLKTSNRRLRLANKSSDNYSYICNPSNLCSIDSSSQAYSRIINNCPEYYNEVVVNGCTPTSAAMLISFYDNYSQYDFYPGILPLKHDDNKEAVKKLIIELAEDRLTDYEDGTRRDMAVKGLTDFLHNHSPISTAVRTSTKYQDYVNFVMHSNNPAIVHINGHAILGVGYAKLRKYNSNGGQYIQDYIVSHYDWRNRPGDYYVVSDEFEQRTFITK